MEPVGRKYIADSSWGQKNVFIWCENT